MSFDTTPSIPLRMTMRQRNSEKNTGISTYTHVCDWVATVYPQLQRARRVR